MSELFNKAESSHESEPSNEVTLIHQAGSLELPLVAAQPGIWMADQIANQPNAFAVAHALELRGPVDPLRLSAAIRQGLSEADTVQARFGLNDLGEPVQWLPSAADAASIREPERLDFSDPTQGEQMAWALMRADLAAPLPADGGQPLYRQVIMRVSAQPERWFWYQRFHHLMLDGFSFDALTRRIVAIYNALGAGETPADSPFTSFADVVEEYQTWERSPACQQAAAFWREHAGELPTPVSLAADVCAPAPAETRTLHQQVTVPVAPFVALAEQRFGGKVQPAEIAMAALVVYLYRMSGESHLSVGFPFMRRMGSAALCACGPVVNVLPLQLTLQPDMTLIDATQTLLAEIKAVRRHQRYEAEQLRRDLGLVGGSEGLYGPVMNFKVYNAGLTLGNTPVTTHVLAMGPVDSLEFTLGVQDGELQLELVANPVRYDNPSLLGHAQRLQHLLAQLVHQPDQAIGALNLLSDSEWRHIDGWGSGPHLTIPATLRSVLDCLQQQVQQQPDALAVVCGKERLSYRELSARVMQLARKLTAQGIGAGDVVAIGVPRSVSSVVAIFGVLTSGAAYMPLDLDYPRERLALMCDDARPALLLTHSAVRAQMPELPQVLCLDDAALRAECARLPAHPVTDAERREPLCGEHLAYMIYTSGSTGKPKGVMSTHAGLLNLMMSHSSFLFGPAIARFSQQHGRRLRAGHTASFSFDSSWEPLFCMMMGSELHVFDEELRKDAWALVQHLNQTPIDLMDITPSFFTQMIDSGLLEADNHQPAFIMIGGEAATPRLWQLMRQHPQMEIHNYYGPSEYTIDTLGARVTVADQPVIGQPVANTRVWLLDNQLNPVPVGVPGELYIAGPGLARGYLRRPDLTATRFVACPFIPGAVMYRTGDLMRWRHDGQLAFIGRVDHQIKVRGFRVELGEVENALVALAEVSTAVVIAEPLGATYRLIGYCSVPDTATREQPDVAARLLAQLAEQLPDYMIPAVLMVMAELPLTVNGKIDRQALPKPQQAAAVAGREAATEQERLICQAIASLLKLDAVSAEADFFALGGDSISAMGLGTLLRRAGWQLRPKVIFAERTPARMAQAMQPLATVSAPARTVRHGVVDGLPIVHSFARLAGIESSFAHGVFLSVPEALQPAHLTQALSALALAHSALTALTRDGQLVIEASASATVSIHSETLTAQEPVDAAAERAFEAAVTRLDPAAGRMMQAVLLQRDGRACGLVLVIHHLVVDGVSWRVLLPELRQAAEAAMAGQPTALPAEECSLFDWSASLKGQVTARRDELPFWQSALTASLPRLGQRRLDPARDREQTRQLSRQVLDAGLTHAVLTTLPERYHARVDEILLGALMLACHRRFGVQPLRLALESHGRIDTTDGLDLGRTVGWLTAEYPVCIDAPAAQAATPWAILRSVKGALRAVPDRGVGYGVLRYLDAQSADALAVLEDHAPEILFNYLGRFESGDGPWSPRRSDRYFRDAFAVAQAPEMPLCHPLDINIFVDEQGEQPQLAIHWGWAPGVFDADDIEALHQGMTRAIDEWRDLAGYPPLSDTLVSAEVAQAGVTDEALDRLRQHYGPLAAVLPVLPLQQGLLFHAQLADAVGSYNSLTRLSLRGPLSVAQLSQALEAVVRHHPQLAARFDTEQASAPLQVLPILRDDHGYWPLDHQTLPAMSADEEADALLALEKAELARDLFHQPSSMLHALLVSHADGERHTLFLNAHHLVVDGWSTPVCLRDLFTALYQGRSALTPHAVPYADIIRQLAARDAEASRQCWREVLTGARPTLLFGDGPHHDEVRELELLPEPQLEQGLLSLCKQYGLTLNSVMQGIWGMLLSAGSGADDVLFGSPVSGRFGQIDGISQQVGLFSNTLPVRVRLDASRALPPQLAELQAQQIQLIEHDDVGLGEIQQLAGTGTLFDTLLVVENYPDGDELSQAGQALRCEAVNNRGYTHYPLTLLVLPGKRLRLLMEYRDSVAQPQRLAQRLLLLLEQLVAAPERPLSAWNLQLPEEQALLAAVNRTEQPVPPGTLHQALAAQAQRTPGSIALVDCQHQLTYRQVQHQTRLLADRLIDAGVRPGDIVAVALPRSVRLSLALYAILEAGAAYLPLDTGYPDERLALMVEDAQPRLMITESSLQSRFAELADLLLLDTLADKRQSPRHPSPQVAEQSSLVTEQQAAYVIYTSGSTGRPKGVVVGHQAIVNRLWWMQHQYPLQADDVVLQKTPCSFDVSVWEFFWPLMTGARLVMAPPDAHRDPDALVQLINDYAVTTMHFVPSMLAAWVSALETRPHAEIGCGSLRRVFCSGEALSRELALNYQSLIAAPLHNLYGPTEAAVDVTWQPASGEALERCQLPGIPIGLPVWNTQLRILDGALRPVPVGVPGDLYLCGIQLAQGYLRRPDLTASRFVADPFATGERMYRTGDIARWLEDGTVDYLGRSDDQLKIRGQRIELGEIEQVLLAQPGVAQAVVGARELGGKANSLRGADARQLVAWLVPQAETMLDIAALQQALSQQLPAHMVPVSYVLMTSFPLSANGKLDRKALPAPAGQQAAGRAPQTDVERTIAALFVELLACETVSAEDDFFALGGHSLLAMRLAAEIRRQLQRSLTVGQIMAARSVASIAALVEGDTDGSQDGNGETLPLRSGRGPVLFCLHPASGFAWQYAGLLRYLEGDYPIVGLQSPRPDGVIARCESVAAMCEHHLATIRRIQPQGPYFLLGYSLGGTLAHGIAARLQQVGETVSFLGLLDTYPPEGQDWSAPDEADAREEVAREQAGFMADTHAGEDSPLQAERAAMFGNIVANYQDAVRLLSSADSSRFVGEATLFVATRTLPADMDVDATWAPYVSTLTQYPQPCEHADILSPASLENLGPLLNQLLRR